MHARISGQIGSAELIIETGLIGRLADGAVTVQIGDTIVFVSAVSSTKIKEGQDWFPLTVDYREKAAAVGRFPGGYFKREGRPTEKETLTCRMTDRPLRPLFPKGYLYDTQIIGILLSGDGENDPDILNINGASAALMVSDIPFAGPIAAVRVGRVDGQFVVNPTHTQRQASDLDLVFAGKRDQVIMIEGAAKQLPEEDFIAALSFAQEHVCKIADLQIALAAQVGKPKRDMPLFTVPPEILESAYEFAGAKIEEAIYQPSKVARYKAVDALRTEVTQKTTERYPSATPFQISQALESVQKKAFRLSILERGRRSDGRGLDEIRQLAGQVGILPRSHGSAIFQRGETQAIALATLAAPEESQMLDAYGGGAVEKRFIFHYNFPPFSVGETGRTGGASRREIGHGALCERSLEQVVPPETELPYAIRITSEVMESNGSTSMASTCAGTLALMDAGVKILAPVAGISVGLVTQFDDAGNPVRQEFLTDIIGSEDFYGDMDFKLCGTRTGVTGFQLDLKLPGIPVELLATAIRRARDARMKILDYMDTVIAQPRDDFSPYAPRVEMLHIPVDKIGSLIGPGGRTIKGITAETGADITIEDDGTVKIYSNNRETFERVKQIVRGITKEIEVGATYHGRVVSIKEFGVFVEVFPGTDGLVHISELAEFRVKRAEDVVKIGDLIWVKCIGVDDRGRVKLSRKAAMKEREGSPEGEPEQPLS
jgi:polyribonucleotide nucleotidyltransferase